MLSMQETRLQVSEKFSSSVFELRQLRTCRQHVLNEEKRDEALRKFETSPRKSLSILAQQTGVSVSSAQNETKLPHLHPLKTRPVRALRDAYRATRLSL
jgi:predicted transcriptional regulator